MRKLRNENLYEFELDSKYLKKNIKKIIYAKNLKAFKSIFFIIFFKYKHAMQNYFNYILFSKLKLD